MSKRIYLILILILILISIVILSGCMPTKVSYDKEPDYISRFQVVEGTGEWRIVADRETKVMYVVSNGCYNTGTFTLLVDAEGEPLLWKDGEEED